MDEAGTQPAENARVSQNGFVVLAKIEKPYTGGSVFRQPWLLIPLFALAGCFLTLCHCFFLDLFAKRACRRSCFLRHVLLPEAVLHFLQGGGSHFLSPRRGLTFSTQRPPGFQNPGGRLFVWGREPALRRASGADWGVQIRSGGFRRGPGSRYSLPQLPAARCSNRPWRTPGWP